MEISVRTYHKNTGANKCGESHHPILMHMPTKYFNGHSGCCLTIVLYIVYCILYMVYCILGLSLLLAPKPSAKELL